MNEIAILRQNFVTLLRRAAVDYDFRLLCLQEPLKAYLELTGEVLNEKYTVCFCEAQQETFSNTVQNIRLPKYYPKTWLG